MIFVDETPAPKRRRLNSTFPTSQNPTFTWLNPVTTDIDSSIEWHHSTRVDFEIDETYRKSMITYNIKKTILIFLENHLILFIFKPLSPH
jgi:hypothetical protein